MRYSRSLNYYHPIFGLIDVSTTIGGLLGMGVHLLLSEQFIGLNCL